MAAEAPNGAELLPNFHLATIPSEKLRDYALSPTHRSGRHKARVFAAVLGYQQEDWPALRDAILAALPAAPARLTRRTPAGAGYEVVMRITGPSGTSATVLTGWVVVDPDDPTEVPRLTTAYVKL